MMHELESKLKYVDALADCFLDVAEDRVGRADFVNALNYTYIAATILCKQNRLLASPRLESTLRSIALELPDESGAERARASVNSRPPTCLHVLREALPAGGLTAMAARWMKNDNSGRIHSAVLLEQKSPIPAAFREAVEATGGTLYQADSSDSFLSQAAWLRELANRAATYVVLHVHNADVVCGIAFGKPGGPPILFVNHSAHAFWVGVSTADLVLNVRGSEQENLWTASRGASRYATVPIPLLPPDSEAAHSGGLVQTKRHAKRSIGLPEDAVVLLTAGASFKFDPVEDLDFARVAENILRQVPHAFVVAAGVNPSDRWRSAARRTDGRILALGAVSQSQLRKIHEATDIYVEGFPIGTPTALLEAGLRGIPAVLAPAVCPPPYGSDGVALDNTLERPAGIEEYEQQIIRLARDEQMRCAWGKTVQAAIVSHHTGDGWRNYLERAIRALPVEHVPVESIRSLPTAPELYAYWSASAERRSRGYYSDVLENALLRASRMGLTPVATPKMRRACSEARSVRTHGTIPLPAFLLMSAILPLLPVSWSRAVFRSVAFACRESLLPRVRGRLLRSFAGKGTERRGYEDYRWIRETSQKATEDFAIIRERIRSARCLPS